MSALYRQSLFCIPPPKRPQLVWNSILHLNKFVEPPAAAGIVLLCLADFCGALRRALAKTGALRQAHLAVSAAGSASVCLPPACAIAPEGLCAFTRSVICGSGAALGVLIFLKSKPTLHPFIGVPPAAARHPPFGGNVPQTAPPGCRLRSSRKTPA